MFRKWLDYLDAESTVRIRLNDYFVLNTFNNKNAPQTGAGRSFSHAFLLCCCCQRSQVVVFVQNTEYISSRTNTSIILMAIAMKSCVCVCVFVWVCNVLKQQQQHRRKKK